MKDPLGTHPDYDLPKRAEDPPPLPEGPGGWTGILILVGLCVVLGLCAAYCR